MGQVGDMAHFLENRRKGGRRLVSKNVLGVQGSGNKISPWESLSSIKLQLLYKFVHFSPDVSLSPASRQTRSWVHHKPENMTLVQRTGGTGQDGVLTLLVPQNIPVQSACQREQKAPSLPRFQNVGRTQCTQKAGDKQLFKTKFKIEADNMGMEVGEGSCL